MTAVFYTPPAQSTTPVITPIDHRLYQWMQGRIHPYRWAIGSPAWGASAEQILARLHGTPPRNGGARKCGPYQIARCRKQGQRLYVTSNSETKGLLWCDVDAHGPSQTLDDAAQAAQIINAAISRIAGWTSPGFQFFPYPSSSHGYHVMLPVSYGRYALSDIRKIYQRFQDAIRRLLHCHGSPVSHSTEIKGHPPFIRPDGSLYCGTFCRLPVDQPWWGPDALEHLQVLYDTPTEVIEYIAETLRATYPPLPPRNTHHSGSYHLMRRSGSNAPPSVHHVREDKQHSGDQSTRSTPTAAVTDCYVTDLQREPDSFARQRTALLRHSRRLGRVPAVAEALRFIRASGLYTGDWDANQHNRVKRVESILAYISQTFDADKSRSGAAGRGIEQLLAQMREYVKSHYPHGVTFAPNAPGQHGSVISVEHIAVFLYLVDSFLVRDANADGSAPRNRFAALWKSLRERGLTPTGWNRHYWLRLREFFVTEGLIVIADRAYGPRKAMRWAIGAHFPTVSHTPHHICGDSKAGNDAIPNT